uniref:Uncharacterized protein n=1 Tax=Oryza rufipogon TaxID=4529 RepID=A0A0E0PZ49_ORYRU
MSGQTTAEVEKRERASRRRPWRECAERMAVRGREKGSTGKARRSPAAGPEVEHLARSNISAPELAIAPATTSPPFPPLPSR